MPLEGTLHPSYEKPNEAPDTAKYGTVKPRFSNLQNSKKSGGGSFAKLGAQYITRDPKIGCADSAFSLLLAQILGAQMRTFAH